MYSPYLGMRTGFGERGEHKVRPYGEPHKHRISPKLSAPEGKKERDNHIREAQVRYEGLKKAEPSVLSCLPAHRVGFPGFVEEHPAEC